MAKEWIVPDSDIGCDGAYFGYQEVVRCRDCKHRILNEYYDEEKTPASLKAVCDLDTGDPYELGRNAEDDNWFCADGVPKDGVMNG